LTIAPPQQKPTVPTFQGGVAPDPACAMKRINAAPSATVSAMSSAPIISRARSSLSGVPPATLRKSGATAWKPATASRRATSRM